MVGTCQLLRTQPILNIAIILILFTLHLCVPRPNLSSRHEFIGSGCQFQSWSAHFARMMVSTLSSWLLLDKSRREANRSLLPTFGRVGRGCSYTSGVHGSLQGCYGGGGLWPSFCFCPHSAPQQGNEGLVPSAFLRALWLECLII